MKKIVEEIMKKNENNLSCHASYDKDAIRLKPYIKDIRPNYFRDIDRIIHTLSYTRYIDKTQVFSNNTNDHISKRIIHVQLVSKIARTIGRALSLNEDLIEAISLGHDLGHVPFGHDGEKILNEISLKYDGTYFFHNVQSVRDLMVLEDKNITIQVLDGILCHNGEMINNKYTYKNKSKEEFLEDYNLCYKDPNHVKELIPMTLEGAVVRISDVIGYVGRDFEDAHILGLVSLDMLPPNVKTRLGTNNQEIVNSLVWDIIENSLEKNYIEISKPIFEALQELLDFNYQNIYSKAHTKETLDNYKKMFNDLFLYYKDNINNKESSIYKDFLMKASSEYLETTTDVRKVIDYLAGMTDDYIIYKYKKYLEYLNV